MDPLVQGLLGASASQSAAKKNDLRAAFWLGLLGGLAPDLDILIHSETDPLLALQFHRHFTHSLAFIPVGGLVVAAVLYPFVRKLVSFRKAYLFATLGWATHGLLDACTSYGTQLLWPFSNMRVSWNNVAIVDPVVTLVLIAAVAVSIARLSPKIARAGLFTVIAYLGLGVLQRERAQSLLLEAARSAGHNPTRLSAKPTVLNNILFRGLYEHEDRFYVAAIRVPWFGRGEISQFESIVAFDARRDMPELPADSVQARDLERFAWFSDNYLVQHPDDPMLIGDLRYSMLPNKLTPMWAVRVNPETPTIHVSYETFNRVAARQWGEFVGMLKGQGVFDEAKAPSPQESAL